MTVDIPDAIHTEKAKRCFISRAGRTDRADKTLRDCVVAAVRRTKLN
jgi:hypothetical protein